MFGLFTFKRLFYLTGICIALLIWGTPVRGDLYVSPSGDDGNAGTQDAPFKTLSKATSLVSSGTTIYMCGGTYNDTATIVIQTDGTSSEKIKVFAIEGESPVIINFSAIEEAPSNRGIVLDANYWHFRGITIEMAGDNGMLLAGSHNTFEKCVFRKNRDTGLQLSRFNTSATEKSMWPSYNLILNCEAYDNCDSGNENADGFAPKLTCGDGNVFRGCVSHHNIDDGWDLYSKTETGAIGVVTLENCIAHNNGVLTDGATSGGGDKNGFKLGSSATLTSHKVRRCIAFSNGKHGFTDNGNVSSIEFFNNTAWNNADYNFHTRDGASHVFKNNISFDGVHTDRIVGNVSAPNALTEEKFDWPHTASSSDFITMIPGPDSDPTSNGFLTPKSGSALVDAGVVSEGINFAGSAPDLGAVETGMIVSAGRRVNPVKPSDVAVRIEGSFISINASGSAAKGISVKMFDFQGKIVKRIESSKRSGDHQFIINRIGLSKGMYILSVKTDRYHTYRIIN